MCPRHKGGPMNHQQAATPDGGGRHVERRTDIDEETSSYACTRTTTAASGQMDELVDASLPLRPNAVPMPSSTPPLDGCNLTAAEIIVMVLVWRSLPSGEDRA
jgi:hypothetical protein